MPKSDNPYDLINALENRCNELNMNACSDINASADVGECDKFVDVNGVFGVPGAEITWDQIVAYWNDNCDDDPVLDQYPDFDSWWADTEPQLSCISDMGGEA